MFGQSGGSCLHCIHLIDWNAKEWEDIHYLQVREELSFAISQPIEHPERFAAMGLSTATGVLLYGPPGMPTKPCTYELHDSHLKSNTL